VEFKVTLHEQGIKSYSLSQSWWRVRWLKHCRFQVAAQLPYADAVPSVLWRCWLGVAKSIRPVKQEAQLSPSDRAMRIVSSNLANYHATVQKLLIRQVLTKPMVWSWRFSWRQYVINKPTTVELCISFVYRRLAVAEFFKVHNVEIAHVTLTTPT